MNRSRIALLTSSAVALTALVAIGLTSARAEDEDHDRDERATVVQLDQTPRAVQDAFKSLAAGAPASRVERIIAENVLVYEIEYAKKGATASMTLSEHGDTLELETPVRAEDLPEAVRNELVREYPGASLGEAHSVQSFCYEVEVTTGGKTHEIKVTPTGSIEHEHAEREHGEDHENKGQHEEEDEDGD
jgi:hypothetical protein